MIFFNRKYSKDKAIFLHIPKTGGTYLSHKINGKFVLSNTKYLNHSYIINSIGETNPLYTYTNSESSLRMVFLKDQINIPLFTVVRNIFDFLVSYAGHAAGWNPKYRNENHYDYQIANKGFEYLLKSIANREDKWPNRKFIFFQVFDSSGSLVPDYILRNETLDSDIENLSIALKLNYKKLSKERLGNRLEYKSYYTDELISLVMEIWKRELDLYGYSFEKLGSNLDTAILPKEITEDHKRKVKYLYNSDKLIITNEKR